MAHGLLEYCSVSLPKKSQQGDSLASIYLYNLTKNLTAQSAHLNYAVLPKSNRLPCKSSVAPLGRATSFDKGGFGAETKVVFQSECR